MRKVDRDWTDLPAKLKATKTLVELEKLAKDPTLKISETIYKDSYKGEDGRSCSRIRDKLNEYYHYKCAYCEMGGGKADIEHYRPKGEVKEDAVHLGYYWLAYEWSNLLPSCKDCNREGGKKTMFPVSGIRIMQPTFLANGKLNKEDCQADSTYLLQEQPNLLHPEIDDPKIHLTFKVAPKYEGVDLGFVTNRGDETIRICDLNRKELRVDRLRCIREKIHEDLIRTFELLKDKAITSQGLKKILKKQLEGYQRKALDEKTEYTLLWWFIMDSIQNFKMFIFPIIKGNNEQLILEAVYNKYC